MNEEKLEKELETYKELGLKDKNVDVASLMISALQRQESNLILSRQKHWAYIISLALPPLGLIFAVKFYFSNKDDGKQTAIMCLVLTIFSLVSVWLFAKILLSGSSVDLNQIQQIKPQDIQQLYQ